MSTDGPCGRCARPWDDHTLAEMRAHHPANSLQMPFERVDGSLFIEGIPGQMVAAVVARAAVVNVPGEGPCPLLLLKFVRADGMTDAVEVALALTPDQMVNAGEMLHQAAAAAAAAAREAAA